MTKFMLLTFNDGTDQTLVNQNFFYAERRLKTPMALEELQKRGWEIVFISPYYTPGTNTEGDFNFYCGGIRALFKKEADENYEEDLSFLKDIAKLDVSEMYDPCE